MPNYLKIGQGNQWLPPASATCDFRISHGTANSPHCTFPAALPWSKVSDFATLSDEKGRVRNFFYYLIWVREPCVRKFEGLARSKLLRILQTNMSVSFRQKFQEERSLSQCSLANKGLRELIAKNISFSGVKIF